VQTGTEPVEAPLTIPGRPVEPETTDSYAQIPGKPAHGVVIDTLSTRVTTSSGNFDPVYSAAVPDSSTTSPEPGTLGAFFPAPLANVVERAVPLKPTDPPNTPVLRDVVVLHPGQFRSASPTTGLGYQQLATTMGYHLAYSGSTDVLPPTIATVDGTVDAGQVTFRLTTPDPDATSATVLYLARSSTTAKAWTKVTLTQSSPGVFTFTGPVVPATPAVDSIEQYFVQLVDSSNNVSVSSKKGQDFEAPARPTSGQAPEISVSGSSVNGHYAGPQEVVISSVEPSRYSVNGGTELPYSGPFVLGSGAYTVQATNDAGSSATSFVIDTAPGPVVTITNPIGGGSYPTGQSIAAAFPLRRLPGRELRPQPGHP